MPPCRLARPGAALLSSAAPNPAALFCERLDALLPRPEKQGRTNAAWCPQRAPHRCQRLAHRLPPPRAQTASAVQDAETTSSQARRVVITGGSKGLGFAMAQEFLRLGDSVVICGRNEGALQAAVQALQREFGGDRVHGMPCDCSSAEEMRQFGKFVQQSMGGVDIWINNAGEVTAKRILSDVDAAEVVRVVGTNVSGSLLGTQQAIRLMQQQPGAGGPQSAYHIFNMGFSRWGAKLTKSAVTHKATKRALTQLTESLAQELREAGVTGIGVHNLSPGMLLTDLLLRDSTPVARRFFNTLAEEPETVAAVLVPRVRCISGTGSSIDYLNPLDAVVRVVGGLPQIINGGRFFDKEGRRVAQPGQVYRENGVRVQVQVGEE